MFLSVNHCNFSIRFPLPVHLYYCFHYTSLPPEKIAYAIDCLLTAILFCFIGYFNGCGKTLFVMLQGVFGAFCVRIPAVYLMSQVEGASLFHIGLGTPISSVTQILLCVAAYRIYQKAKTGKLCPAC